MVIKNNLLDKNFSRSMARLGLAILKARTTLISDDISKIVESRKILYAAAEEYRAASASAPIDTPHNVARARGLVMLLEADNICKDCSDGVRLFLEVVR